MALPKFYPFTETWHSKPYAAISPTRPELSAAGKNVVVTGAGSGIGKAIAIAFAQAGAASITLLGRRLPELEETASVISAISPQTTVLCQSTDISIRSEVEAAFTSATQQFGPPDILINNAATLPTPSPLTSTPITTVEQTFTINVFGALSVAQIFLSYHTTPSSSNPTIININSGISHMAPLRSMGIYAASKAANAKLFEYLCLENPGCHVVNVQPGVVNTEMNADGRVETQDEPELPGHFCVWLASSEAKFLRGKFVWVNWDVGELQARAEEIASSRLLTTGLDGVPT